MRSSLWIAPLLAAAGCLDLTALEAITFGGSDATNPVMTDPASTDDPDGPTTVGTTSAASDTPATSTSESTATAGDPPDTSIDPPDSETATTRTTGEETTDDPPMGCDIDAALLVGNPPGTRSFITDVASFDGSDLVITGAYAGALALGDLEATDPDDPLSPFIARVGCDGHVVWIRRVDPCGADDTTSTTLQVTYGPEMKRIVLTGRSPTQDFLAWYDAAGQKLGAPSPECFEATSLVHDVEPLLEAAVVAFTTNMGAKLALYADGVSQFTQPTLVGQAVAMTGSSGTLYAAEVVDFMNMGMGILHIVEYDEDLGPGIDLGLEIGPVKLPSLSDPPEQQGGFIAYDGGTLLAVAIRSDGNLNVLIDGDSQKILSPCDEQMMYAVFDTAAPELQLVGAECIPDPTFELRGLQFVDGRLMLAGLLGGPQPSPVFMDLPPPYAPGQFTSAELTMASEDPASGALVRVLDDGARWIVAGGFPATTMNFLGVEFAADASAEPVKENLFLGRVTPPF